MKVFGRIINFLTMEGSFWRKPKIQKTPTRVHLTFEEYQEIREALMYGEHWCSRGKLNISDARVTLNIARWRTEKEEGFR